MTLIDTLVVTNIGTNELGAIGAMAVVLNIMQMSVQAINVSNIAVLPKARGEKNDGQMKMITGNSIIITILISMIKILFVYVIRPIFPALSNVNKICITYITITLIGFTQNYVITVLIRKDGMAFTSFIPYLAGSIAIIDRYFRHLDQVDVNNLGKVFDSGKYNNLLNEGFQEGYYPTVSEIENLFKGSSMIIIF